MEEESREYICVLSQLLKTLTGWKLPVGPKAARSQAQGRGVLGVKSRGKGLRRTEDAQVSERTPLSVLVGQKLPWKLC